MLSKDSNLDVLNMDSKLLTIAANVLSPYVCQVINMSMKQGICPADWKIARITPVYKNKGSKEDVNNYRPISVIPHIAKVAERVVQAHLKEYLLKHSFISESQSAYLPKHSTQTSLHKVLMDLLNGINENEITGLCLFDLQKCFDTIDHELLLFKMQKYGINNTELSWFNSYLSGRTQTVKMSNTLSEFLPLNIGVPQGTVLGPILFLLFINDLPTHLRKSYSNLFADDTAIYVQASQCDHIQYDLQLDINNLSTWFNSNRLTVNVSKTCLMKIGTLQKLSVTPDLMLFMHDSPLVTVQKQSYLGCILDECLSFDDHVNTLVSKLASKLYALRQLRRFLTQDQLVNMYQTLIQPCIDYCITVYGYCSDKNINKVQRLMNRATRIITGIYDWDVRGITLLKQLGLMSFTQRRDYFMGVLTFKCLNGHLPDYLADQLIYVSQRHSVNTRSSLNQDLYQPKANCKLFKQSFEYRAPATWNKIPHVIRNTDTIDGFKVKYRAFIMNV